MLVSNIDPLPSQIVKENISKPKGTYMYHYQIYLYIISNDRQNRISVSINKTEEKIEYNLFNINQLTEQICLLLLDNESEKRKAQELCTEHMSTGSKALNEFHVYSQNHLEKFYIQNA